MLGSEHTHHEVANQQQEEQGKPFRLFVDINGGDLNTQMMHCKGRKQ